MYAADGLKHISWYGGVLLQTVKRYQLSYHVELLLEEETRVYPNIQPALMY